MDKQSVSLSVRKFITTNFPLATNRELGDGDLLLKSGIIDSLGVLDLINFVESEYGIQVVDDELVSENFETIGQIVTFIEAKQDKGF